MEGMNITLRFPASICKSFILYDLHLSISPRRYTNIHKLAQMAQQYCVCYKDSSYMVWRIPIRIDEKFKKHIHSIIATCWNLCQLSGTCGQHFFFFSGETKQHRFRIVWKWKEGILPTARPNHFDRKTLLCILMGVERCDTLRAIKAW